MKVCEEVKRELLEFWEWFDPKHVKGLSGTDTQIYRAMRVDYKAMLASFGIDRKFHSGEL